MMRTLSPYEKNHLIRHGFDPEEIEKYGEMPVEYITGQISFCGQELAVTPDTLIPRVETEELVDLSFKFAKQMDRQKITVADIGTGCGAIGLSLFLKLKKTNIKSQVFLSDIAKNALKVAEKNKAKLISQSDQAWVIVLDSNLLDSYPQNQKFDLIIANLPYIPSGRISSLQASVKDFEPHLALDGGEDGLKYIRELLNQSISHLYPTGKIIMEVDYTHTGAQLQMLHPNFRVEVSRDQFDRQRFAMFSFS